MRKSITLVVVFGVMFNFAYSQNKKEQIEAMNYTIDSLNKVVVTERALSEDRLNQITELSQKDKSNQALISGLKNSNDSLLIEENNLKNSLKISREQYLKMANYLQSKELNPRWELSEIDSIENEEVSFKITLWDENKKIASFDEIASNDFSITKSVGWNSIDSYFEYVAHEKLNETIMIEYNLYGFDQMDEVVKFPQWKKTFSFKNESWIEMECQGKCR